MSELILIHFSLVDSQDVVKVTVQRINKNNINELIHSLKEIFKKNTI